MAGQKIGGHKSCNINVIENGDQPVFQIFSLPLKPFYIGGYGKWFPAKLGSFCVSPDHVDSQRFRPPPEAGGNKIVPPERNDFPRPFCFRHATPRRELVSSPFAKRFSAS